MQSDGGISATARPTFRGPSVSTEVLPLSLNTMQDSLLDRQDLQGSQGSPAEAGSGVQGRVYVFQPNILLGRITHRERAERRRLRSNAIR